MLQEKETRMATGIIGMGNMGTALANLIAHNGHEVLGWEYAAAVVDQVNDTHTSPYLADIPLSPRIRATHTLADVIRQCPVIFITLPSRFIEPTLHSVLGQLPADAVIVNIAKGLDASSGETAFARLQRLLPNNRCVHLSGPSIANEYAHGLPTAVVLASHHPEVLPGVSRLLDCAHFRTRHSSDPSGVELGGVLKNIYAFGLGVLSAAADNINFKGAYLTAALQEMQTLGVALGAKPESFLGIAGIGDLIATALSEHSHNVGAGKLFAAGKSLQEVEQSVGTLPEGYFTLLAALQLASQHDVSLPVASQLRSIVEGKSQASALVSAILAG